MPRAWSSASSARKVISGCLASRSSNHCRSPANTYGRLPPTGRAAALPVARNRCDHFTTLATLTLKVLATARQLSPADTAPTTRSRRSREYARAIDAGLQSSQHLESESQPLGNPLSIQDKQIML